MVSGQVMLHNLFLVLDFNLLLHYICLLLISGNSSSVKVQKLEKLFTVRLRAHQRQSCAVK